MRARAKRQQPLRPLLLGSAIPLLRRRDPRNDRARLRRWRRRIVERGLHGAADANDQRRQIMIGLFPDVAKSAARGVRQRQLVTAVECGARDLAAVGADIGENVLAERIRKIHLAGEHVLVVDEYLEVDMNGAAGVPAGIDAAESGLTACVRELGAAHKGTARSVDVAPVALAGIAGIIAI